MSTIICGFSGIGKSTAEQKNRRILDFESSGYSNIFENGFRVSRNKDFPKNYIDKLEELIKNDEAYYYLLSCHEEVRNELKARGLKYIIVLPYRECKNEYKKIGMEVIEYEVNNKPLYYAKWESDGTHILPNKEEVTHVKGEYKLDENGIQWFFYKDRRTKYIVRAVTASKEDIKKLLKIH